MNRIAFERRIHFMQLVGCIACRMNGESEPRPGDVHHLNWNGKAGQKRRGDEYTIVLCPYHHRGVPTPGVIGPSLALQSRTFRVRYGSDDELLALTNELIEKKMAEARGEAA